MMIRYLDLRAKGITGSGFMRCPYSIFCYALALKPKKHT